jgi:hypothetical protein
VEFAAVTEANGKAVAPFWNQVVGHGAAWAPQVAS